MNKFETILHPVRFRIIQMFLDGQSRTAKNLSQFLTDIPQATLYRQLDTLVKAEVLRITEENQIRGTVEKVYSLNFPAVSISEEELNSLTREEHLDFFMLFTTQLVRDFDSYLKAGDIDYRRDGVGYRQYAFHLSDEEFASFLRELGQVYGKYSQNKPSPDRIKRIISNIIIPEKRERET